MHEHGGNPYPYLNDKNITTFLDFSANINCFGMPEKVKQAAIQGVYDSIHYPDPSCHRLKASIGHKLHVKEEWIFCGNGAAELIYNTLQVLRPQKTLVAAPGFFEYEQALQSVDCDIVYGALPETEEFRIGSSFLQQLRVTPGLNMVILANPNNPTGQLIPKDVLKEILEICRYRKIWIMLDECFLDFTAEFPSNSLVSEIEKTPRLLILKAFTKMYAMPGLRMGYLLCSDKAFREKIVQIRQPWSVSLPAQEAAVAALEEGAFAHRTRAFIQQERPWLQDQLQKLGLKIYHADANFLLFFSPFPQLQQELLKQQILIRDCGNFTGLKAGYYRIVVRTHEKNLRLIQALHQILNESR